MPRRLKLYLENSIISMYFQDDAPYLRDLTRKFWVKILPNFDVYISETVLDEIRAIEDLKFRRNLENLVKRFKVLEITEDILRLENIYLSYRRLPRMDARHLSIATLGEMNFIVTWNLRHLYKRGTQEMVREVNIRLRLPVPIITTPEDFFEEEEV
jgi:predicted nucleic acid-binding protein